MCVSVASAAIDDDVEKLVAAYFAVPAFVDDLVLAQRIGEAEFKVKLKGKFAAIFAEPLLGRMLKWLARVRLPGTEVADVFDSWRLAGPRRLNHLTREADGQVKASYRVTLREVFSEVANWPANSSVDSFVADFKVTNVSSQELRERLRRHSTPELVELEVTGIYDMAFDIQWMGGRGRISEIRKQLISSTLTIRD